MTDRERRIQSCIDHINTAVDVDPWAKELVAEMGKEILKAQLSGEGTTSDCISRQAALELGDNLRDDLPDDEQIAAAVMAHNEGIIEYQTKLSLLPSVQPTHINTSNTLKSLDCVDRQKAIDAMTTTLWHYPTECLRNINKYEFAKGLAELGLKSVPSVQPVDKDINVSCKDAISRQAAIDAAKKNTFRLTIAEEQNCEGHVAWSAEVVYSDVMEGALLELPSAQPEPQWIPVTERLPEPRTDVWVNSDIGQIQGYYEESVETWYASFGQGRDYLELIVNAWMPLPEPYQKGE